MNISTLRAMLERRGYDDFFFHMKQGEIECTVCGPHVEKVMSFDQQEWETMTVEEARIYLDQTIGEGMIHVMHVCGQGLLQADEGWNVGESSDNPYSDLPPGYYTVPVDEDSEPVEQCPGCRLVLNLARGLPRVDDPDELLPENDDFDDDLAPRDLEFVAGELALHENDFTRAEEHFRTTLDLDDLCLTDARQYLGLTLIWQGKLEEAAEHFELDLEDRGVRLSGFFAAIDTPNPSLHYVTWNSVLSTSILIGFFEEIPFRGFIFQKLQEKFPFWIANLLSSLLFLGIHLPGWILLHALTWSNVISIFVLGVIFAIIFYSSKTLWSSILTHSLNDFLSSVLFHIS